MHRALLLGTISKTWPEEGLMYAWLTALMDYYWQCRAWGKYETMFFARQKLRAEIMARQESEDDRPPTESTALGEGTED